MAFINEADLEIPFNRGELHLVAELSDRIYFDSVLGGLTTNEDIGVDLFFNPPAGGALIAKRLVPFLGAAQEKFGNILCRLEFSRDSGAGQNCRRMDTPAAQIVQQTVLGFNVSQDPQSSLFYRAFQRCLLFKCLMTISWRL